MYSEILPLVIRLCKSNHRLHYIIIRFLEKSKWIFPAFYGHLRGFSNKVQDIVKRRIYVYYILEKHTQKFFSENF